MEIKCTVQELKELLNKETPVAGTTEVLDGKKIANCFLDKCQSQLL